MIVKPTEVPDIMSGISNSNDVEYMWAVVHTLFTLEESGGRNAVYYLPNLTNRFDVERIAKTIRDEYYKDIPVRWTPQQRPALSIGNLTVQFTEKENDLNNVNEIPIYGVNEHATV